MRKFFLTFSIILCLALFDNFVFCADYYLIGVDCYKKGVYDKACSNLEHAVRINPKNVNARYYLAQVYIKQKRVNDAKNQYQRIIHLSPESDAAILSQKGLSLIKQAQDGIKIAPANTGNVLNTDLRDNYLNYILLSGKPVKWKSFPINVYIENKKQKDLAKKAFQKWQNQSGGVVGFNFINSGKDAQITVNFNNKLETSSTEESYIAGYSKPYYQNGYMAKSEIYILTYDSVEKKDIADDMVFFALLHEIGHSLGFRGHSPDTNDVMYESSQTAKELSKRDINTLKILYSENPMAFAQSEKSKDLQLQQVIEYTQKRPDKAVGWSNLADLYRVRKNYPLAIENYKKAIEIEPQKAELYNLLGTTYSESGDKKNAFLNLKMACDLDKLNSFYLYQFAELCLKSGKKAIGQKYIDTYLQTNPSAKSDEKVQQLLKHYK